MAEQVFSDERKEYFSEHLLSWYGVHKRDLPWRRSKNPYYVWVSEVMLQQTRVDTVIPYFHRFIEKFPTIQDLALAPEEEVLKMWEGLGYYSRARNLQGAVREVHERYGGIVPDKKEEISSLKGVGPYTSGAVLSIAYNKPEPAVDGNVMRVLSRFFLIHDDITRPATRVKMERLAKALIPEGRAGDFNQALMELGALVCTPRSPQCLTCPVMEHCEARLTGSEESLPVKKKAKPPRPERRLVALIVGEGEHAGKVLIRQRPPEGLLARMWELPHVSLPLPAAEAGTPPLSAEWGTEAQQKEMLRQGLADGEKISVRPTEWFTDTNHTFSHIFWDMKVYRCQLGNNQDGPGAEWTPFHYKWMDLSEMGQYAFPKVFLGVLRQYAKEQGRKI